MMSCLDLSGTMGTSALDSRDFWDFSPSNPQGLWAMFVVECDEEAAMNQEDYHHDTMGHENGT